MSFDPTDFTAAEALAAILRITNGNVRLLERLLTEIARILWLNQLQVVTTDVVETARAWWSARRNAVTLFTPTRQLSWPLCRDCGIHVDKRSAVGYRPPQPPA